jgi:hypothetical protein
MKGSGESRLKNPATSPCNRLLDRLHKYSNICMPFIQGVATNFERTEYMKSILEELYGGDIYPAELIVPKDPEYHEINKKISSELEAWSEKLSKDGFKQLETFIDLISSSNSIITSSTFLYGFKLGAVIMIEVLTGKEELARGTGN